MARPVLTEQKFKFKTIDRPVLTTSTLPQDLLKQIAATAKTNKAVELAFDGDPIGARRVLQRLVGLAKRGSWDGVGIKSARRGGKLYVWLDSRPRGRTPDRSPEHSEALPPEVTPSILGPELTPEQLAEVAEGASTRDGFGLPGTEHD
jgi:hypothetical protein